MNNLKPPSRVSSSVFILEQRETNLLIIFLFPWNWKGKKEEKETGKNRESSKEWILDTEEYINRRSKQKFLLSYEPILFLVSKELMKII